MEAVGRGHSFWSRIFVMGGVIAGREPSLILDVNRTYFKGNMLKVHSDDH